MQQQATFDSNQLRHDALAGTTVFLVALPLCLGLALASGAPVAAGLLGGIVGGLLVGALSGSHTSVSGPAAGLTAVVAQEISDLGSFESFLLALMVAGLLQIIFGVIKAGNVAHYFPTSVVRALLAAIGLILVLKQIPHLMGWDVDLDGEMAFWQTDHENTFSEITRAILHFHTGPLLIGIVSLALTWVFRAYTWNFVITVLCGSVLAYLFNTFTTLQLDVTHLVQVPISSVPAQWRSFLAWPDFSSWVNPQVYLAALTIAVVASLETLLNLEAVDKIDPQQRTSPKNRELVAQGIGNTTLGLIGGIPVTSVVIRSAVNLNCGARSKHSAIIHGLLLALFVLFFPQTLNLIPLSSLAAILIVTGFKLASPQVFRETYQQGYAQFVPFLTTVFAILFTDLLTGVILGLAVSLLFILHSHYSHPLRIEEENRLGQRLTRVILSNQVSFLNRISLKRAFEHMQSPGHLVIDGSATLFLDRDMRELILDETHKVRSRGVSVSIIGFGTTLGLSDDIQYDDHATLARQNALSTDDILQVLKEGNLRVTSGRVLKRNVLSQITNTSVAQYPLAAILACIDSRAPSELVFDLGIGDAFSVRMAGNVVSDKILGSLEFACAVAGAKLLVVMGHTKCGAITAAVDFLKEGVTAKQKTGCDHLDFILKDIQESVLQVSGATNDLAKQDRDAFLDEVCRKNIEHGIEAIRQKSSTLRQLESSGQIRMIGCIYDVRSGQAHFLE